MRQSAALTTRFLGALSQGLRAPTSMAEAPLVLVQARGNATKGGNGSAASKALLRKLADESKQEQDYKPDEVRLNFYPNRESKHDDIRHLIWQPIKNRRSATLNALGSLSAPISLLLGPTDRGCWPA